MQRSICALFAVLLILLAGCGREGDSAASGQQEAVPEAQLTITALKAGAADAFVLISDSYVAVIDTGLDKNKAELTAFLRRRGVERIDSLIISHFDKDHVGGADALIKEFEIGKVYTTFRSKESEEIDEFDEALSEAGLSETVVREELSFTADGVEYSIYPPQRGDYGEDNGSNNSSLVVRVAAGESSMLFAGDAEKARIKEILNTEGLQSTVLKVPHHGRLADNTEKLVEYVAPEYAVITSSKGEPEDEEVLDILADHDVESYLTREGDITIVLKESGVEITQDH